MENSDNLKLPYIMASQAQKHVTHNEAVRMVDALVQMSVVDKDLSSPPSSPLAGSRYIIASAASGDWTGKEKQIAAFQDGAWKYFEPGSGWIAWVEDEEICLIFSNNEWQNLAHIVVNSISELQNIDKIGINATADNINRLAINSPASLFSHQGAGHQIKLNKASTNEVSSVLFQDNWNGTTEIGTIGNNDFSVKVSADGSQWNESIVIENGTGKIKFPSGITNPALSGIPDTLDQYDFLYIDAINGDDGNDGLSKNTAVQSFGAIEPLMPVGRRVQIRLLSDIDINHVIRFQYSVPLIEIYGRTTDDSAFTTRTITVSNAVNKNGYCGGLMFFSYASVYLRNLNIILNSTNTGSLAEFFNTLGFLRTFSLTVSRGVGANCYLFSNGYSFVPNSHSLLTVDPTADGFIAKGVPAGANPNNDWRYPSNVSSY